MTTYAPKTPVRRSGKCWLIYDPVTKTIMKYNPTIEEKEPTGLALHDD